MPTLIVRYQVPEEGVSEIADAVKEAFAGVEAQQPSGVRWIYGRLPGSTEFVAVLELADGAENPLLGIGAATALQGTVARLAVGEPPKPQPLEVLGSYDSTK